MIRAKKSLGQNFLIDDNILKTIVNCIDIKNKTILEIGPGTGNLTSYILKKKPKKIFVVEKDTKLAIDLKNKFEDKLIIINDDVINQISQITDDIVKCDDIDEFKNLIIKHENLTSNTLNKKTIKEKLFNDFNGEIKLYNLINEISESRDKLELALFRKTLLGTLLELSFSSFLPSL